MDREDRQLRDSRQKINSKSPDKSDNMVSFESDQCDSALSNSHGSRQRTSNTLESYNADNLSETLPSSENSGVSVVTPIIATATITSVTSPGENGCSISVPDVGNVAHPALAQMAMENAGSSTVDASHTAPCRDNQNVAADSYLLPSFPNTANISQSSNAVASSSSRGDMNHEPSTAGAASLKIFNVGNPTCTRLPDSDSGDADDGYNGEWDAIVSGKKSFHSSEAYSKPPMAAVALPPTHLSDDVGDFIETDLAPCRNLSISSRSSRSNDSHASSTEDLAAQFVDMKLSCNQRGSDNARKKYNCERKSSLLRELELGSRDSTPIYNRDEGVDDVDGASGSVMSDKQNATVSTIKYAEHLTDTVKKERSINVSTENVPNKIHFDDKDNACISKLQVGNSLSGDNSLRPSQLNQDAELITAENKGARAKTIKFVTKNSDFSPDSTSSSCSFKDTVGGFKKVASNYDKPSPTLSFSSSVYAELSDEDGIDDDYLDPSCFRFSCHDSIENVTNLVDERGFSGSINSGNNNKTDMSSNNLFNNAAEAGFKSSSLCCDMCGISLSKNVTNVESNQNIRNDNSIGYKLNKNIAGVTNDNDVFNQPILNNESRSAASRSDSAMSHNKLKPFEVCNDLSRTAQVNDAMLSEYRNPNDRGSVAFHGLATSSGASDVQSIRRFARNSSLQKILPNAVERSEVVQSPTARRHSHEGAMSDNMNHVTDTKCHQEKCMDIVTDVEVRDQTRVRRQSLVSMGLVHYSSDDRNDADDLRSCDYDNYHNDIIINHRDHDSSISNDNTDDDSVDFDDMNDDKDYHDDDVYDDDDSVDSSDDEFYDYECSDFSPTGAEDFVCKETKETPGAESRSLHSKESRVRNMPNVEMRKKTATNKRHGENKNGKKSQEIEHKILCNACRDACRNANRPSSMSTDKVFAGLDISKESSANKRNVSAVDQSQNVSSPDDLNFFIPAFQVSEDILNESTCSDTSPDSSDDDLVVQSTIKRWPSLSDKIGARVAEEGRAIHALVDRSHQNVSGNASLVERQPQGGIVFRPVGREPLQMGSFVKSTRSDTGISSVGSTGAWRKPGSRTYDGISDLLSVNQGVPLIKEDTSRMVHKCHSEHGLQTQNTDSSLITNFTLREKLLSENSGTSLPPGNAGVTDISSALKKYTADNNVSDIRRTRMLGSAVLTETYTGNDRDVASVGSRKSSSNQRPASLVERHNIPYTAGTSRADNSCRSDTDIRFKIDEPAFSACVTTGARGDSVSNSESSNQSFTSHEQISGQNPVASSVGGFDRKLQRRFTDERFLTSNLRNRVQISESYSRSAAVKSDGNFRDLGLLDRQNDSNSLASTGNSMLGFGRQIRSGMSSNESSGSAMIDRNFQRVGTLPLSDQAGRGSSDGSTSKNELDRFVNKMSIDRNKTADDLRRPVKVQPAMSVSLTSQLPASIQRKHANNVRNDDGTTKRLSSRSEHSDLDKSRTVESSAVTKRINMRSRYSWSHCDLCMSNAVRSLSDSHNKSLNGFRAATIILRRLEVSYDQNSLCHRLNTLMHKHHHKQSSSSSSARARNNGPLIEFLFNKSTEGISAAQLLHCVKRVTAGEVYGKFLSTSNVPQQFNLKAWITYWSSIEGLLLLKTLSLPVDICTFSAALLVTACLPTQLSTNQDGEKIWQHMAVTACGAGGSTQRVQLSGGMVAQRTMTVDSLKTELSTEPVIHVDRDSVLTWWTEDTPLNALLTTADQRWKQLNVLGQVVNVLRERQMLMDGLDGVGGYKPQQTPHISLPTHLLPGITLLTRRGSPAYFKLRAHLHQLYTVPDD